MAYQLKGTWGSFYILGFTKQSLMENVTKQNWKKGRKKKRKVYLVLIYCSWVTCAWISPLICILWSRNSFPHHVHTVLKLWWLESHLHCQVVSGVTPLLTGGSCQVSCRSADSVSTSTPSIWGFFVCSFPYSLCSVLSNQLKWVQYSWGACAQLMFQSQKRIQYFPFGVILLLECF